MRTCPICCRFIKFARLRCRLFSVYRSMSSSARSPTYGLPERWRRDGRRRAHPQLRHRVEQSPATARCPRLGQRRPLNPVARALAGPKSGPRARTWDEVGGKEEPAVHPRSPSSPAPHARRWRLHQPACPGHAPMARTGCGYTEPSPFHSSTAGTCKA